MEAWNTDAYGYEASTRSLYQSHPWVLAVLPNGAGVGVLADTTQRCTVPIAQHAVQVCVTQLCVEAINFIAITS